MLLPKPGNVITTVGYIFLKVVFAVYMIVVADTDAFAASKDIAS